MESDRLSGRCLSICMSAVLGAVLVSGCAPKVRRPVVEEPIRAVWVTRWDYRSADDIRRIVRNAESVGLNTVFFQVRGQGTVLYRSRLEPWADEIGGRDPGFDPLRVAVVEAHGRGVALHAWVNVMPSWKGKRPPRNPRQLYNAHPEWHLIDRQGRRQPLSDHYVMLNPAIPEARDHIVAVCREIVGAYDVDGLHLDYIRFVTDESGKGREYPYDPRTLGLYKSATRLAPEDDPDRWNAWRRGQITQVVRDIGATVRRIRPGLMLSAAVLGDRVRARNDAFQDAEHWLRAGLIDAVCPMAYRRMPEEFERLVSDWRAHAHGKPVIPGIGIYNHRSDRASFEQLKLAAGWGDGFALFAYSSLFPSAQQVSRDQARRAEQRRRNLTPMLKRLAREADERQRAAALTASFTGRARTPR